MTEAAPAWRLPVLAAAGSLVVTLPRIAIPSAWWDEAATRSAIGRPWGRLIDLVGHVDLVHLVYYSVAKTWTDVLGTTSVVSLRVLSALLLAVAAVGFAILVRDVSGSRVARLAALLFVVSPAVSGVAFDARSQALFVSLVVWALVALRFAATRGGRRWWAVYAFLVVITPFVHLMTVLMLPVHLLCAWAWGGRRPVIVIQAVSLVAVAPFAVLAERQSGQIAWIDLDGLPLLRAILTDQVFTGDGVTATVPVVVASLAAAALLAVLGITALMAHETTVDARLAAAWLSVPTLLLAIPTLVDVHLYVVRYLVYTAPAACWLAALGWQRVSGGARRAAVGVLAFVSIGVLAMSSGLSGGRYDSDYRALAKSVDGADSVLFATVYARGVAVAYPSYFVGLDDPQLSGDAVSTDTIFGEQRPVEWVPLRGRVVAFVGVTHEPENRTAALAALRTAGCTETERFGTTQWIAIHYDCG